MCGIRLSLQVDEFILPCCANQDNLIHLLVDIKSRPDFSKGREWLTSNKFDSKHLSLYSKDFKQGRQCSYTVELIWKVLSIIVVFSTIRTVSCIQDLQAYTIPLITSSVVGKDKKIRQGPTSISASNLGIRLQFCCADCWFWHAVSRAAP